MAKARQPRGFIGRRIYQLLHAPKPVFRAVFSNVSIAALLTYVYLLYDLQVETALRNGADLSGVIGGRDLRTEAAALLVLGTVIFGSLMTYVIVPQPRPDGKGTARSGWSAVLGFFASLPVAYIALVIESQFLKPLFARP
ncbi:MAG: hypothetical protein WCP88_01835 [bacterium]